MITEFINSLETPKNYRPAGYIKLKGKKSKVLVYELFGHQKDDVRIWKEYTKNNC